MIAAGPSGAVAEVVPESGVADGVGVPTSETSALTVLVDAPDAMLDRSNPASPAAVSNLTR
jgi:hypothetical protein